MSEKIIGRNAVTEALNSDREIEKIILAKGAEGSIKKIEGKAKAKKIPLYYSDKRYGNEKQTYINRTRRIIFKGLYTDKP